MICKKLLLSFLSVVVAVVLADKLALAQERPESDPRFEKLAKEFYPKAKQEGALVVYDVMREKEVGSPIDFVRGALPVVSPQQAAIYVKAPHPTAAKLFAEWLISPEGQAAIDAVGRASARKGFKSKTSIENAWGANTKPIVVSNKAYIENARKWLDTAVKPLWEN
jgi:ABC-type glycerol-3-phosphate transport system substrate-binding protein